MNFYKLRFLISFFVPIGVIYSILGSGIQTYNILIFAFIILPILELFLKADKFNLSESEETHAKKSKFYDLLIYAIVPIQYTILILFLNTISKVELSNFEMIGIISAFGISCGILGINVAHELGHRHSKFDQLMSKLLLITSQYLHFFIEHNRGHHKLVSTDEDPASARYNENIYFFYFRTIIGSYISAWKIENDSLKRKNISIFSWKNQMLRFQVYQFIFCLSIGFIYGWITLLYYLISASIGFLLLETVNYIQHYGLRRNIVDEVYERVQPSHSWNSDFPLGRIFLFELSRHSDHHHNATRKYQVLRSIENSPQMPTGYPGMMILALIPPLWFKVMHKRIEDFKKDKL